MGLQKGKFPWKFNRTTDFLRVARFTAALVKGAESEFWQKTILNAKLYSYVYSFGTLALLPSPFEQPIMGALRKATSRICSL